MRRILLLACLFLCAPFLRAHGPLECTLGIFKSDEGYELISEFTIATASRLLPAEEAETFSAASLASHRRSFEAAVGKVCNLLDPKGQPIASTRDLISMNREGEVRIVRLYAPDAQGDAIRFDLLAVLPIGQFCVVTDHRTEPAVQKIIRHENPLYPLAAAPDSQP